MTFVQNFPFFAIMLYLAGGVICSVLDSKKARFFCQSLNLIVTGLMLICLLENAGASEPYIYMMGHFPAPWGNELRIGTLELVLALAFSGVMFCSLAGGMGHILEDVEEGKVNLYFTVICLLMSAMLAMIFTNDLFTAYVFIEINTIASCALVMLRYTSGRTLVATTRYLTMSLVGSSMFLLGVVILYSISGHLLMQNIHEAVVKLVNTGAYQMPLTVVVVLFTAGISVKCALFPFYSWLPMAHGTATASSSAILSGLVLKSYIFLLIKVFYRVIGLDVIVKTRICDILFVFGMLAMILGSVRAMQMKDLKKMLAFSSVAQVGYIFLGIGLANEAGFYAACVQMLAHAFTKPMLFIAAGGFMTVSGGNKHMNEITGAGFRDPLGGAAFIVGSLSMIGIPFFASFNTKVALTRAAIAAFTGEGDWKMILAIITIVISTLLNALYYLPVIFNLFTVDKKNPLEYPKAKIRYDYVLAMVLFIIINIGFGMKADLFGELIQSGLNMLG